MKAIEGGKNRQHASPVRHPNSLRMPSQEIPPTLWKIVIFAKERAGKSGVVATEVTTVLLEQVNEL